MFKSVSALKVIPDPVKKNEYINNRIYKINKILMYLKFATWGLIILGCLFLWIFYIYNALDLNYKGFFFEKIRWWIDLCPSKKEILNVYKSIFTLDDFNIYSNFLNIYYTIQYYTNKLLWLSIPAGLFFFTPLIVLLKIWNIFDFEYEKIKLLIHKKDLENALFSAAEKDKIASIIPESSDLILEKRKSKRL